MERRLSFPVESLTLLGRVLLANCLKIDCRRERVASRDVHRLLAHVDRVDEHWTFFFHHSSWLFSVLSLIALNYLFINNGIIVLSKIKSVIAITHSITMLFLPIDAMIGQRRESGKISTKKIRYRAGNDSHQ